MDSSNARIQAVGEGRPMRQLVLTAAALVLAVLILRPSAQQAGQPGEGGEGQESAGRLMPTNHPRLPRDVSLLWMAPARAQAAAPVSSRELASALKMVSRQEYSSALSTLTRPALQQGPLALYASYYAGIAEQELGRHEAARRRFRDLQDRQPIGYLAEASALGEAASLEALNEYRAALRIYERLSQTKTTAPEDVLMRLARAAKAAGELQKAGEAFARVYYEFPLNDLAEAAGLEFQSLPNVQAIAPGTQRFKLELGRAERLFGARQYSDARAAFEKVRGAAEGDDRELVQLRIAESDYFLKKYRPAADSLRPFSEKASRQGEALYFYALTLKALNDRAGYEQALRRVVAEFPTQSWAEDALNALATDRIRENRDAEADEIFRQLYANHPRSRHSERAAWKIGWRSYREGRYEETTQFFEQAAADFPRSDYRPAWLYWSGRAHEAANRKALAEDRYMLVTADYLNSYYGRLAAKRLKGRHAAPRVLADVTPSLLPPPPNEPVVRALLDLGAYELALNEIRYAQRAWGDSPALQATQAWIFQRQGQSETGTERFRLLRGSITAMKRAYPQYMAAGGEQLPRDVLSVIFPLDHFDLIKKYSPAYGLDPYLVAALMAQESTFVRDIRSHAGAYGLMQLMPRTARQYARRLKIPYSRAVLTNADANVRIGTAYLADKIKEFGDLHLALASYNAGETPVRRWIAERPGLTDREEFIDDIPYPETQAYVKKLLGTTDDYRRLYGPRGTN
jgi:soluble lytic murein transglycosylase